MSREIIALRQYAIGIAMQAMLGGVEKDKVERLWLRACAADIDHDSGLFVAIHAFVKAFEVSRFSPRLAEIGESFRDALMMDFPKPKTEQHATAVLPNAWETRRDIYG
ncbi:hypothetical protein [Pacificibacter marinus]|uniref:hypothetical protein n=1 Tax=Pacificibacter marinus TaxID=658057 RepID=UPI001C07DB76|nr:hypothetical protein [Pacificibacter marinus]MBU2867035.1 hypothetical protein [Pacificibacter marinus]